MKIDYDSLTYEELVDLNQKIVERLKFLDSMHRFLSKLLIKFVEKQPVILDCFFPQNSFPGNA